MPDQVDPAARLRAIGRRDTPPLDPARLASIETRVLTTTRDTTSVQPTREVLAGYGRKNFTRWAGVAAAVIVLAVVAGALLTRGTDDGLVIEAAEGVVIDAAGDGPATAAPGDRVVDGAIVEIAPYGSATIGGIAYGPGRYVVDDGALRPLAPEPPATGDDRGPPAPDSTTTTTSTTSTATTVPPPARRPTSTTSSASTRVPATEPRATRPPPTSSTSSTSTSRPARSTTTTTSTLAPVRTTTSVPERATTSRPATITSTTSPRRP